MKFIIVNGPSCTGKSTAVNQVLEKFPHFYKLSYDAQKWHFSKYDRTTHFDDVHTVVRALAETVCKLKYNIICDSALYKKDREFLFEIVKKHGYEIVEINLEAEYEVVAKRFDERVASALANKSKTISNTSKERFKEIYDIYQAEKNLDAIEIRTDTNTPEEVAKQMFVYCA